MNDSNSRASDNALMVRYQRGDLGAYEELVQRHLPGVYTVAHYIEADPNLARDLTLRVFAELARRAGEFRDQSPFSTWLYRLAMSTPAGPSRATPGQSLERQNQEALAIVAALPDSQRTVFLLKQVASLQFAQIADIIGTDIEEVKERMRKALLGIQKVVQERRSSGEGSKRISEHQSQG